MTKKELELEVENLKIKNKKLELNLDYAKAMENESAYAFGKILEVCNESGEGSKITIKITKIIFSFVKRHKELEQEKRERLGE